MLVAIGSGNPVKVNAVKNVFKKAFVKFRKAGLCQSPALSIFFVNFEVNSSVSDQPIGDDEIIKGAINRAKLARKKSGADFGVGLEGGVIETKFGMMESAWCAVVNNKKTVSLGGGMHFLIPKKIAKRIRRGEELGPIMDDLTGREEVKKQGGAVEVFTKGLLTRTSAYCHLVKMALSKFLAPEWFE